MSTESDPISQTRVLLAVPTAKDAEITSRMLATAKLSCVACQDLVALAKQIPSGAGAVVIVDEVVAAGGVDEFLSALRTQPAWSDLPVVLMVRGQTPTPPINFLMQSLTNVTVLERPAPMRSVISTVQAAVRGRQRQYQIREQLYTIREAEERLAFSMEAGNLGSWEVDLTTMVMTCSARFKENFSRDPTKPFSYDDLFAVIHSEDRDRVAEAVRAAVADHTDYVAEYRVPGPDGSDHWVSVRGRAVYSIDGTPLRIAGVSSNITEQKRVELHRQTILDAERAARSEAERVGRMKDEFLATLSHELRTPLNAILGWCHLLQMVPMTPEDLKEGLSTIDRNARVQTQLIDDLLDMSRIISGKTRMDIQSVDPVAVIQAATATVQPAASAKGVHLQTHFPPEVGTLFGDSGRLQQVIWNLLSNSIKFTPPGGKVQVHVSRRPGDVEIVVSDTGQGIDPEFLPYVFERFRQADSKSTREHGGLGLGLAIVKHLVELHGGDIAVTSPGKQGGAAFTIHLPVTRAAGDADAMEPSNAKPGRAMPPALASVNFSGLKVLVVDDEPDARELLRRVFQGWSASVVLAGSAAEALAAVSREQPNVIVSDIGMPVTDGYALMRKVRALDYAAGGKIPSIALTAFARAEDRNQALLAGYDAHLAKPIEPSELLATVATVTGRS